MQHEIIEDNGIYILSFEGDIDLENSGTARSIMLNSVMRSHNLVIDMTKVTMIDSSGVASLLEGYQKAHQKNQSFILASISDPVMRVFKLARLETVFDIVDSIEGAVAKARIRT